MTRTPSAAAELARAIAALARPAEVDVAIAPSFPALDRVRAALSGSGIALAAQDVFPEREGAFTGEVSAAMLKDAGVSLVLVGPQRKAPPARRARGGLRPQDRAARRGRARAALLRRRDARRARGGTHAATCFGPSSARSTGSPRLPPGLALAYEPVWAIGTGLAATPEMAADAHAHLRAELAARFGEPVAALDRGFSTAAPSRRRAPRASSRRRRWTAASSGAPPSPPPTSAAILAAAAAPRA